MREASLPPEFNGLTGKIHNVRRKSPNEYSSSCPFCMDGDDRFIMLVHSSATGSPMGWCRVCGKKWWPGLDGNMPTAEERARALEEYAKYKAEQELRTQRVVDDFARQRPWETYHKSLNPYAISLFHKRGITDEFIRYWRLGYRRSHIYFNKRSEYKFSSDSLTIPIIEPVTRHVVNVKHRILNPDANHKYEYEWRGLPQPAFVCNTTDALSGKLFIVEGEFKAMTTFIALRDKSWNVAGINSSTPDLLTLDIFKDCEPIYVALDPDAMDPTRAFSPIRRIAKYLGDRCFIVYLPGKIDDLITDGGFNSGDIKLALARSKRIDT